MMTSARRDNQGRDDNRVALRCISMAAHPSTGDGEAIGCLHAYRRLTRDKSFEQFCIDYFVPDNMKVLVKEKHDQTVEILQLQELLQVANERADRAEEKLRVLEILPPNEPVARFIRKRWTAANFEYLACEYEADPTIQNKVLAIRCSQHFGREITKDAIGGQIDRLRKMGRLPKYRPGYEKGDGSAPAC